MRKNIFMALSAAAIITMSSCSSKMGALSADNFEVTPNPLEAIGGKVPATINGKFPEKYMKKKAVVTVTPVLRYANGMEAQGQPATFQGEKIMGNDQTISYRLGGRYTMKTTFDFIPEMQKSDLYLTFNAKVGKKTVAVPDVKVADGIISTAALYRKTMLRDEACLALDTFQRVQSQKQEANIRFLINQAELRKSELKNNSVQEFVQLLKKINADRGETMNVTNVEVAAYASPEGGFDYNNKLAGKRQDVSEAYVNQQLKETQVEADVDAHYTAQDWDGFQQLVQASNIQDKDVILRVLSMYKDPQEREQQIRNLSLAFQDLVGTVLPELRRARLTVNYELIGRDDEQIDAQYAADPSKLSLEELLYAATFDNNYSKREEIYKTANRLYPTDYRALNNLAVLAFSKGDQAAAKKYLQTAIAVDNKGAESYANLGLIELHNGNLTEAENYFGRGITANGYNQAVGTLNIAKGNYAVAEGNFGSSVSNTAALAQLLNKDYEKAIQTLDRVQQPDAMTMYLHAIVAARRGNKFATESYLQEALKMDPSLKTYADNDLELSILK